MTRRRLRGSRLRTVAVFASVYLGLVTLLTMATHGWYPVAAETFCGSLGDFTDRPVPAVCLSFPAYWLHALVHPPYALAGAFIGGIVAWGFAARGRRRSRWST